MLLMMIVVEQVVTGSSVKAMVGVAGSGSALTTMTLHASSTHGPLTAAEQTGLPRSSVLHGGVPRLVSGNECPCGAYDTVTRTAPPRTASSAIGVSHSLPLSRLPSDTSLGKCKWTRATRCIVLIALCTKLDARCDKLVTVVGRTKLTWHYIWRYSRRPTADTALP